MLSGEYNVSGGQDFCSDQKSKVKAGDSQIPRLEGFGKLPDAA